MLLLQALCWMLCPQVEPLVGNKARKSKAALLKIFPKYEKLYI